MDPEILRILEHRMISSTPLWEKTALEARSTRSARERPEQDNGGLGVSDVVLKAPRRNLPLRVYKPATGKTGTVLFFHGGGFVTGNLDTHHDQAVMLCQITGRTVVSVDYRLAPENPFPSAVDDALYVADWVLSGTAMAEVGLPDQQLAVAGASAGANLAANVAHQYARHGQRIAAQLLAYPWMQAGHETQSRAEFKDGLGLSTRMLNWYEAQYLPNATPETLKSFSLIGNGVHRKLPSTVLSVAMMDPLRDDGLAYEKEVTMGGTRIWSQHAYSMPHGFWGMTRSSTQAMAYAREFCTEFASVLDAALGNPGQPN